MVVAGVTGEQSRVDVLDLRTWRWREGIAQLRRPGKDSRGVSVVAFEGKVVAVGGQKAGILGDEEDDEQQQQQQQEQQDEEEEESPFQTTGVREVHAYDQAANTWSRWHCATAVWDHQGKPCGGACVCLGPLSMCVG
jgi:hypothetical protein